MRVLAVASVAVLALFVALWFMILGKEDEPAAAARPAATSIVTDARADASVAVSRDRPGAGLGAALGRPAGPAMPAAPIRNEIETPVPSAGSAKPRTFRDTLDEQLLATEATILECIQKASGSGRKLEGITAVGFVLARKDGKVVVESTGVEYSTLDDQPALDCIREAAHLMVFDSLPEGADAITGYRKVGLTDGVLVEHRLTEFAITRGPGKPAP